MKNLKWLMLSLLVIVLDQWTKFLAATHLQYLEPVTVIPHFFNLTLSHNTGASFGFLNEMSGWQRWFFSAVAIFICVLLFRWLKSLPRGQVYLPMAISLIMGGAVGNLIDRLRLSYVIDFIQWYYKSFYWPTFNIADSAVVVGAVMLAIYYMLVKEN